MNAIAAHDWSQECTKLSLNNSFTFWLNFPTCILFTAAMNNRRLMDEEGKAARRGDIMKGRKRKEVHTEHMKSYPNQCRRTDEHITSYFICHPSFPDLSLLPPQTTPRLKTPCQRRILLGCSAKRETHETHCPPLLHLLPHPLQETQSERWSSRSQTCCSWLGASTLAYYGCRSRSVVLAKELAAPQKPPAFLLPPPERSLCVCPVKWVRWCQMNAGHWELEVFRRWDCWCWSPEDSRRLVAHHFES